MGDQADKTEKRRVCAGLLAHVDAGKTTLSEGMLYLAGQIRKPGRVDHGDAFLDTFELERERGITIFSKQALLPLGDLQVTLLDTPGHVDFSAEMERALQVMDYAILVISGTDGVQGHTRTLWRLLERYHIPTFLFINKMDQPGLLREELLEELKRKLGENCLDFGADRTSPDFKENIAMCEESLLEEFLETGEIQERDVQRLIRERKLFPCYFGSALKMTGVKEFMEGLQTFMLPPEYPDEFGARIFKISRDSQKNRLTFMKITGGSLRVKEMLGEEKVDQIRLYSGARYELLQEAGAGTVCAVTGPAGTFPGQGIGREASWHAPVLAPVLNYRILLPEGCDVHGMLKNLRELEEEDPQLHIVWNEKAGEISVSLMGEVQTEILKRQIWDRFHTAVDFGPGKIVYKETIENTVEGVGHFEPLRHYAEVHLLLEPGEPGSGCQFFTACSEDVLDRNWQRLVLTHLEEREHVGVLTGSALTDVQITLLSGRAHVKHTEGGDFRQATYRAVRQGLRKARSVLLEPCYDFCLEVPPENVGRAMKDIGDMKGEFLPPETEGEMAVLRGSAPVSAMRDYQRQVISYTRGRGQLSLSLKGYVPCREQAEVVEEIGYDPDLDPENPTGSVFCAHGAGFLVPWDQVEDYMHLESEFRGSGEEREEEQEPASARPVRPAPGSYEEEKELQAIFDRTFGPSKRERERAARGLFDPVHRQKKFQKDFAETAVRETQGTGSAAGSPGGDGNREAFRRSGAGKPREEYLLVDGYNIIFAWEELKELAGENLRAAQTRLMDILCNYQGYMGCVLILVFDAYRVEGHPEEVLTYHNIHVVYTREAETADQYIEKTVHRIGRKHNVTVATSDGLEQIIVMGAGARRLSAQGLYEEICEASRQMRLEVQKRRQSSRTYLFDQATQEVTQYVETVRLGKNRNS